MRYRMMDFNGDYQFGHGLQDITYGTYAVAQAVKTKLCLLKEEWWENTELGLPLFQNIIGVTGSQDNLSLVDAIIKSIIATVPNVTSISNFTSTYKNRNYSFQCDIATPFGNTVVAKTF